MTPAEIAAGLSDFAHRIRGWRFLGKRRSNGEVMCAGCWDRSDHDTEAEHDIPPGHPVFWSVPHPEYGDCDAYCLACVAEDARDWEIITNDEYDAVRAILEKEAGDA